MCLRFYVKAFAECENKNERLLVFRISDFGFTEYNRFEIENMRLTSWPEYNMFAVLGQMCLFSLLLVLGLFGRGGYLLLKR